MPYYKRDNDTLMTAQAVYAPGFELTAENRPTEPVDGWMWFDSLEDAAQAIMSAPVDGVPQAVTKRQGRAQLKAEGLLSTVEGFMGTLPADHITRMAYDDSSEWHRRNPNLVMMLGMIGKTESDADKFFIDAAKL
jgi:hypothetical protein